MVTNGNAGLSIALKLCWSSHTIFRMHEAQIQYYKVNFHTLPHTHTQTCISISYLHAVPHLHAHTHTSGFISVSHIHTCKRAGRTVMIAPIWYHTTPETEQQRCLLPGMSSQNKLTWSPLMPSLCCSHIAWSTDRIHMHYSAINLLKKIYYKNPYDLITYDFRLQLRYYYGTLFTVITYHINNGVALSSALN